jgi:tetratricopeptide (TPR) repeat protein
MLCLWSEQYDSELGNNFDSQAELAVKICHAVPKFQVTCKQPRGFTSAANSGLARHACSLGFHSLKQRSVNALRKAVGYFKDAIELDPSFADAFAGLADVYISLSYNHLIPARTAASLAWEAAQTAFRINKHSILVNNAYVNSLIHCNWNLDTAERLCKQMIGSGRLDSRTLQLYANIMTLRNRHEESIRWALHANDLADERYQASLVGQVALSYFYSGDYDNAVSNISKAIESNPQYMMGYVLLGRVEEQRGNWDRAISAFTKAIEASSGAPFGKALLAAAHASSGDKTQAHAILTKLAAKRSAETFPAHDVSVAYAALNREAESLVYIRSALKNRDIMSIYIEQEPRFSQLRKSLEFQRVSSLLHSERALPEHI